MSDAALIAQVRQGSIRAVDELFRLHMPAAITFARSVLRDAVEAEALALETFARVIRLVAAGGGPDASFRAYFLRAVRNGCVDYLRAVRDTPSSIDDVATTLQRDADADAMTIEGARIAAAHDDPLAILMIEEDADLARRALGMLPARWHEILLKTDVEGLRLGEAARTLGLDAGAAAALRYRAHEALREAFLVASVAHLHFDECGDRIRELASFVRGTSSRRSATGLAEHLLVCRRCRAAEAEMRELNGQLLTRGDGRRGGHHR